MLLSDQVAIVTGAGRNIGEETAKLLAKNGARVAVVDIDEGLVHRVASDIVAAGGRAESFVCDVGKESDIERCAQDVRNC
jgi:NAD(P)-dependent dehydrogenase (short-subunit alcohol dehydrogenase family)